jgi:hypothetical protein
MDQNFYTNEFEQFLQEKAEQHKMYPSENVWRSVYRTLHTRKKGFIAAGALLLLSSLYFITQPANEQGAGGIKNSNIHTPRIDDNTKTPLNSLLFSQTGFSQDIAEITNRKNERSAQKNIQPVIENDNLISSLIKPGTTKIATPGTNIFKQYKNIATGVFNSVINDNRVIAVAGFTSELAPVENKKVVINNIESKQVKNKPVEKRDAEISWLKNTVAKNISKTKSSKLNLLFYFSPAISFRKLEGTNNKPGLTPLANNNNNINNFVNQTPAIGIEGGSGIVYNASKMLNFKAGVQMNLSRYNIQAYRHRLERTSFVVNNGFIRDTIAAYSSLRSLGNKAEQIQNQYLQVSIPIGAEFKLLGNNNFQVNIAGTIQPSYLITYKAYLLTSDYNNYAMESSLIKRWNVSTSFETYFSYKSGGVRWQVGPQVRYQLFSTFNKNYPVKEYLMEYGIKLGISKTLK